MTDRHGGEHVSASAADEIDARIRELGDWRGEILARVREIIKRADPEVVEEVKWRKPSKAMAGVRVWSHDGIICTGETYKDKVKLTFAAGLRVAHQGHRGPERGLAAALNPWITQDRHIS